MRNSPMRQIIDYAEGHLGRAIPDEEAAGWICVTPRTFRKYRESSGPAPHGQIKLAAYAAAIAILEHAEKRGVLDALLPPAATPTQRVIEYLEQTFAIFDPLNDGGPR